MSLFGHWHDYDATAAERPRKNRKAPKGRKTVTLGCPRSGCNGPLVVTRTETGAVRAVEAQWSKGFYAITQTTWTARCSCGVELEAIALAVLIDKVVAWAP